MNILLTGDRGYIGTVMKKYLRERGHTVMGLDTNFFADCKLTQSNLDMDEPHIDKDIRDVSVDDLVGYDAVIHLAGLSNDQMGNIEEYLTYDINSNASIQLAIKSKSAGVKKFLFASSCSVYGASDDLMYETSPLNPLTTYAKAKAIAEMGILPLSDATFSLTCLRNATVFGYSPRHRNDLVVNTMTSSAFTTKEVTVMGDGNLWRPLVNVLDVARAFALVLEASSVWVSGEIFNVGTNAENYTVGGIADLVKKHTRAEVIFSPSSDVRNYRVNFDKLCDLFPKFHLNHISVDTSIRELVEVYRDYEAIVERILVKESLLNDKFIRLDRLNKLMVDGKLDGQLRWV